MRGEVHARLAEHHIYLLLTLAGLSMQESQSPGAKICEQPGLIP